MLFRSNLIKAGVVLTNDDGYKGGVTSIVTASNGTTVTVSVNIRSARFSVGDQVSLYDATSETHPVITMQVTSSTIPAEYLPVTNSDYEDTVNESKRRIKIISPEIIEQVVREFESII